MRRILALSACLAAGLVACGTPLEQCVRRETAELRQIDRLIEELRATLDRGYAIGTQQYSTQIWKVCSVTKDTNGNVTDRHYCWRTETFTRKVPVAIDPAEEQRKLAGLERKRRDVAREAAQAVDVCRATHPE